MDGSIHSADHPFFDARKFLPGTRAENLSRLLTIWGMIVRCPDDFFAELTTGHLPLKRTIPRNR
jgi:hypothetical protein